MRFEAIWSPPCYCFTREEFKAGSRIEVGIHLLNFSSNFRRLGTVATARKCEDRERLVLRTWHLAARSVQQNFMLVAENKVRDLTCFSPIRLGFCK